LYIAPWVYNCNCDTIVFNTWLEDIFIPQIEKLKIAYPTSEITLILDNVAYHKSQKTKQICETGGINLKFQPPYSPDLNPIESSWDTTKNDIRNQSYTQVNFVKKLDSSILRRTWGGL
jgi:transposase